MRGTRNADEASITRERSYRMLGIARSVMTDAEYMARMIVDAGCGRWGRERKPVSGGMTRVMRDLENGIH